MGRFQTYLQRKGEEGRGGVGLDQYQAGWSDDEEVSVDEGLHWLLSICDDANVVVCSFFGEQEGDFELHLYCLAAFKHVPYRNENVDDDDEMDLKTREISEKSGRKEKWWKTLLCGLV